jgi:hypothetical protein
VTGGFACAGFGLGALPRARGQFARRSKLPINPPNRKALLRWLWNVAHTTGTRSGFAGKTAIRTRRALDPAAPVLLQSHPD